MESELKFTPRRFSDEEIDLLKKIYARVDRMHSSLQKTKEDFKLLKTEPKSLDKVELLEPVLDLKVSVGLGKGDTHGGVVVEEKQNMPLRNFVEQVADQKQEVVMMDSSTENLTTELYYVDYGPLKQKEESIELVVTQIQNTTGKLSYIRMERKNLGVRHISVKRRYHRTRKKKSTSRPDYVQALKSYGMFSGLSLRDRLGNQKAERTHFKRTRSMVNTGCEREVLIVDHGIRRYLKENHGGENMKCLDHVVKISYNDLMIMEVQGDSKSLHQGQMHQGNKLLMPNDENGFDESFNWRNRGLAPRKDVNLHQITSYSVEHEELVSLMFFEKGIKVSIYELGLVTRACQRLKPSQNKGLFKDLGAGTFHLKLYVWDPGQVQLHMGIYGIVFMEKYEQFVSVAHIKQTCVLRETLAENLCVEDWSLSDQVLTITLQLEKATAGVRVGLIRGEFIANLTGKEIKESQLELFSAGTDTATLAREGYRPSTAALSYEVTNKDHHNYQDFIEDATVGKRRFQYEDEVRKTSLGKQILVFSLCSHAWSKIVSRVTQLEGLFSYLFGIEKFSLEVSSGVDLKARIECSWDPGGWCLGQVLWDFREGVSSDSDELRKLCGGPFSVLVLRLKSGRKSMDWDRIGEANKVSEDAQVWKRNAHENEQLDIGQKRVRELAWRNTYYMGKYKLAPDRILSIKVHSLKWEMFLLTNTFIQLEDKLDPLGASNSMWRMMSRDIRKTQSQEELSELSLANQVWEPGGKSFKELRLRENGNMEISDHWSVGLRSLLDVISIAIGECEVDVVKLKTEVKQMQRSQEFFHVRLSRTEKSCGYGKEKVISSLIKRSISTAIFRKVPCAISFLNNRPMHHDIKSGSKFFLLLFMWSYSQPKKLLTESCIKQENQKRAKMVQLDCVIMRFRSFITNSGFEIMFFCRIIDVVNDLMYLGKSCLLAILRTEKINRRAGVVSFTLGKVENILFIVLTYGRFHLSRLPELSANDEGLWFWNVNGFISKVLKSGQSFPLTLRTRLLFMEGVLIGSISWLVGLRLVLSLSYYLSPLVAKLIYLALFSLL